MLGFAAGVMIAASIWSLLIPAIEMAEEQGKVAWVPATIGFIIGILALILVNNIAEKISKSENMKKVTGMKKKTEKKRNWFRMINGTVLILTVIAAVYIMANGMGLIDSLDFGAGAYYYAFRIMSMEQGILHRCPCGG